MWVKIKDPEQILTNEQLMLISYGSRDPKKKYGKFKKMRYFGQKRGKLRKYTKI